MHSLISSPLNSFNVMNQEALQPNIRTIKCIHYMFIISIWVAPILCRSFVLGDWILSWFSHHDWMTSSDSMLIVCWPFFHLLMKFNTLCLLFPLMFSFYSDTSVNRASSVNLSLNRVVWKWKELILEMHGNTRTESTHGKRLHFPCLQA